MSPKIRKNNQTKEENHLAKRQIIEQKAVLNNRKRKN